jgi:hypothetical protein
MKLYLFLEYFAYEYCDDEAAGGRRFDPFGANKFSTAAMRDSSNPQTADRRLNHGFGQRPAISRLIAR